MLRKTFACFCSIACLAVGYAFAQDSAFSVSDSIEMIRFNAPRPFAKGMEADYSPDGRYLVVITSRGILATDKIESSIWLWDTKAVARFIDDKTSEPSPIRPRLLARVAAVPSIYVRRAYEAVVSDLRWSLDGKSLYFLGENLHAERVLYKAEPGVGCFNN